MSSNYFCLFCPFVSSNVLEVTKHMERDHQIPSKGKQIKCLADANCNKTRDTLQSLREHSKECMRKINPTPSTSSPRSSNEFIDKESNPEAVVVGVTSYRSEIRNFFENLSVKGINPKTIDEVNKTMQSMLGYAEQLINASTFDKRDSEIVSCVLKKMKIPLKETCSDYKRKKILHSSNYFISPKPIALSIRHDLKRKYSELDKSTETADFYFVAPTDILKKLFLNKCFRDAYTHEDHVCQPGIYRDFCCGNYKQTGAISELPEADLPKCYAQLYADAADVNDAKNKRVSVTFFYLTFRNIPARFNTQLKNIHPIAMAYSHDLTDDARGKGHNYNKIMKHIVQDLSKLESGIEVAYEDDAGVICTKTLTGGLVSLCNDNKGFSEMLCLAESTNTTYFCRFCYTTREQSKTDTNSKETLAPMRGKGNDYYEPYRNAKDKTSYVETKGIANESVLTRLKYFSLVDTISIDVFHDGPEGIMPLVLRKVLGKMQNIFWEVLTLHQTLW